MSTPVELIKERLSILDVVEPYVELKKAGRHFKGKSPFTNEKTPSFFVSPDRGMYYCFSTSKGGDIFTFIEEMEGVDFKGALKILAERAGVELVAEDPKKRSEREQLYAILEQATAFFEVCREEHPHVTAYLEDRGVTQMTMKKWRIGFAPDEWRALRARLQQAGFSDELILKSGLIKRTDSGKEPYDVFRNRVMFPIADPSGRVVAFSGRTLSRDENTPKYVNSPETELYQKSEILFGYDKAKHGIRSMDFSLVVEGQFDLVLAHQVGYTNTVAISGTALTKHHLGLIERLSKRVVLALDSDRAGINSIKRGAQLMIEHGMDTKVAVIPEGKDPADLVHEDPKLLKEAIGKGVHVVEFLTTVIKKEAKDDRTFKLRVREEVLPFLVSMENRIDREHFEGYVAAELGTSTDAVHYEVERLSAGTVVGQEVGGANAPRASRDTGATTTFSRTEDLALHLVGILLWQESIEDTTIDTKRLREALKRILGDDGFDAFMSTGDERKNKVMFEVETQYGGEGEAVILDQVIREQLTELRSRTLKGQLAQIREMLRHAEQAGNEKDVERLIEESAHVHTLLSKTDSDDPFLDNKEGKP